MVFRVGDDPIKVRWYFVDCDHENMPLWTPFSSANWVSRVCEAGALGEQPGARPWANGSPPANAGDGNQLAVECVNEHVDWWTNGLGVGESSGPYLPSGLPACCTCAICGDGDLPPTLTATVQPQTFTCPCWGSPAVISLSLDSDSCTYVGSATKCGELFELVYSPPRTDGSVGSAEWTWGPASGSGISSSDPCFDAADFVVTGGAGGTPCSTPAFFISIPLP